MSETLEPHVDNCTCTSCADRRDDDMQLTTMTGYHDRVYTDDLNRLLAYLGRQSTWVSMRDIARQCDGLSRTNDRAIRAMAAASDGRIISGQRGYRLTSLASNAERDHAIAWYTSQAAKMIRRAERVRARSSERQTQLVF
jgi:hypothetical protein